MPATTRSKPGRFVAKPVSEDESELSSEESDSEVSVKDEDSDLSTDDVQNNSLEAIPVTKKQIIRAVEVLKEVAEKTTKKKGDQLFGTEYPVLVQIECVKVPACTSRKLRFALPNTIVPPDADICLFVSDLKKGKRVDHEPTIEHYEALLKQKGVNDKRIKVVPMRQVRVEHDQFEMKRALLTQYEVFLVDARISGHLSHKLGDTFRRKNKMPTPLSMDAKDLKGEIEKALRKSTMKLHGEGNTYTVQVSSGNLNVTEVFENIKAVIEKLSTVFPGGASNVQSIYIKNPLSMAIPLYVNMKNPNDVKRPVIKPMKPQSDFTEGELSTQLGSTVRVYRNGIVNVKRKLDSDESESEDDITQEDKEEDETIVSAEEEEMKEEEKENEEEESDHVEVPEYKEPEKPTKKSKSRKKKKLA